MGLTHRRTGPGLPRTLWTRADSVMLGNQVVAAIVERIHVRGHNANDQSFEPHSTKPIYIAKDGPTGLRLAPKGGRESRTGKSVYYEDGYRGYKLHSRGSAKKTLVLSGELGRSWRVKDASATHALVGMTGDAARYGTHLNRSKHSGNFAALSPKDRVIVLKAFRAILRARMDAGRKGRS